MLCHQKKEKSEPKKDQNDGGKEIARLQTQLASHFGTRVQVKSDGKKGRDKNTFCFC